jgi:hypothetical protein
MTTEQKLRGALRFAGWFIAREAARRPANPDLKRALAILRRAYAEADRDKRRVAAVDIATQPEDTESLALFQELVAACRIDCSAKQTSSPSSSAVSPRQPNGVISEPRSKNGGECCHETASVRAVIEVVQPDATLRSHPYLISTMTIE